MRASGHAQSALPTPTLFIHRPDASNLPGTATPDLLDCLHSRQDQRRACLGCRPVGPKASSPHPPAREGPRRGPAPSAQSQGLHLLTAAAQQGGQSRVHGLGRRGHGGRAEAPAAQPRQARSVLHAASTSSSVGAEEEPEPLEGPAQQGVARKGSRRFGKVLSDQRSSSHWRDRHAGGG